MKKAFILGLFILFASQSYASAIIGGEITQNCLGGNTFQTTISLINDCAGADAPDSVLVTYQCLTQASLSFSSYAHKIAGTGNEVTPWCYNPGYTTCQGGTEFGCREFIYQHSITMNNAHNWKYFIQINGRGTNHSNSSNGNDDFYLEGIQNLQFAACNSTASYSNKAVAIIIVDQSFCFNHGAIDPDGDSLVYSFSNPLEDSNQIHTYNYPYTSSQFIPNYNTITIDPVTGDICLSPSMEFRGITKVKVEEYRNVNGLQTLVSVNYREIFFKPIIHINHIPTLSGMDFNLTGTYNPNDTTYSVHMHIGDTIHFHINGFDEDTLNPMFIGNSEAFSIMWNYGIPDGSFTPSYNGTDSAYADFFWVLQATDTISGIDNWCFTSTIQDDGCPYNAAETFSYCILLDETPVGIHEPSSASGSSITIYPNPAEDFLQIELQELQKELLVTITDVSGKIISREYFYDSDHIKLNIHSLAKGYYLVSLKNESITNTQKFIKN